MCACLLAHAQRRSSLEPSGCRDRDQTAKKVSVCVCARARVNAYAHARACDTEEGVQCHNKRQEYIISSKGKPKSMWQGKRKKRACRNPGLPLEYCLSYNSFPEHISVPKNLSHVSFDKTAVKWEEERP